MIKKIIGILSKYKNLKKGYLSNWELKEIFNFEELEYLYTWKISIINHCDFIHDIMNHENKIEVWFK